MTEDLRAWAERWIREVWNERREATVDELMAPQPRSLTARTWSRLDEWHGVG